MKLSKFHKNILRHSLVILVCLVVLVLCIIGITKTIKDIFELREVSAETNPPKVNLVCLEEPVVIEPETVYFDVPLSHEVQDTIFAECEKHGISPAVVVAQIEHESKFDTYALGDDGRSAGLMQVQAKHHLQRMIDLDCTDLFDPIKNVIVGIDYLAEQLTRYGDIEKALTAYNSGHYSGTVTQYAKTVVARAYELGGEI